MRSIQQLHGDIMKDTSGCDSGNVFFVTYQVS